MDTAIEYNNLGVAFLEVGQIDEGLDVFKDAVELSLSSVRGRPTDQGGKLDRSYGHERVDMTSIPVPSRIHGEARVKSSCLFNNAIYIPTENSSLANSSWVRLCCAMILYNTALAHHMKSFEGSNDTITLKKAIKLYEVSYTLVKSLARVDSSVLRIHVLMAIINNIGFIYYQIGRYNVAAEFFSRLSTTIISLSGTIFARSIPGKDFEFFLLNIMVLVEPSTALAA